MKRWKRWCAMVLAALLTVSSVQLPVRAEGTAEKLTIAGLTASSEYAGNLIGKANDGDAATFWETDWRGSNYTPSETNPIVVTASFAAPTEVGTMKIVQRKGYDTVTLGQPNGRFIKAKYTFLGENDTVIGTPVTETYELNENNIPLEDDIVVDVNQTVKSVKIEILQAYHTTATMAELEFYAPAGTGEPEVPANGITAIEANTQQTANNQGIEKAIDGDPATFWHSAWSGFSVSASNPAVVTITRPDGAGAMGELLYTTRPYGGADGDMNGNILQMNIYTSNDKAAWVKLTDVTWDNAAGTKSVNMKANTDKYVKLEITSGYRNFATAAEFSIAPFDNDVSKVDISLMETVRELGLSETDSKGWTADSAQALLAALNTAQAAYDAEDVLALIAALEDLQAAYHALTPDKQPLQEMIVTAKATSCVGMNQSSVANLKRAIANAEAALKTVANPLEVQFEIGQLEEAIAALSPEAAEDIQDVTGLKALQRENNFNEGWLFQETTADLSAAAVDEAQFESVNLPHDFSISKDFTTSGEAESGFLQGGTGWYRKHLTIPAEEANKNFTLVFDGAYMDTTVYVNGEEVGQNHNGYNQFAFDITDKLVCDGTTDNVIAVKVVNDLPSSRWYSGSGIYRDVTLQVTNATHVDYLGMFVATPEVSATEGTVKVTNTIVGKTDDTKVKTVIYDKDGQEVAASELTAVTADKAEQTLTVANPELWTVKTSSPALYKAVTAVYNGETKVDEVESTFGFKYVEFDRETGFSLNGENMKLKGVCMHHDQGALGAAANYHAVYRQMKIMKDMGANAIRVTHNPASEALLRACDELGLLVINEAFDHFYYSKNLNRNDFARWFKVAIGENGPEGSAPDMIWAEYVSRQMVKTSRNHASMLMYSVGNELLEGGGSDDGYIQMTADVCSWFAAEDPYHKPTIGDNHAKNNNARALAMCDEVSKAGGIVGLNYTNPTQYQSMRDRYPNWIIYGSETSSANHSRGVYNTEYKDLDRLVCSDYENEVARVGWGHSASTAWKHVADHAWNLGEFVWTGFDYLGEPTPWNNIGAGSVSGKGAAPRSSFFGIVETTGFEKDIYYLYQSLWNDDVKTLHMTRAWNDTLLKSGENVTVQVFSDAPTVKLYLNGEEVGTKTSTVTNGQRKFGDKYFAEFKLPYEPGTISAKAFEEDGTTEITGTEGIHEVTTAGPAAQTELSVNKESLDCDGYDLAYVTVDVLDADGNFVPESNQKLYFTLEGEGRIVGVDNGNQSDTQSFRIDDPKQAARNAFNGKALVIIQSTKRAGEITLKVKGAGIEENSITLNSVAVSTDEGLSALEFVSKYTTLVNEEAALPETVTGILENGTTVELNVTWDADAVDYTQAGTYTVKGTLEGYTDVYATATVTVYDKFAAAANYTAVMHEGEELVLPQTRTVYYADGTNGGEFPVTWEYYDASAFTSGQNPIINGTVLVADDRFPVTAKIRVEEALPESRNLARLESDMPTLAQSCVNTADNLNSLNNGIKVSTAANERWTDWAQQDVKTPWVSYTWDNKYTVSEIIAYIYQDGTSVIPKAINLKVETLNDAGEWVEQEVSYITPIAYNDGDGKTTINLAAPAETNGIRLHMEKPAVNSFTGLTELEVFEYVPTAPAETDKLMTDITIGGEAVEGFAPETNDYEILTEEYPVWEELEVVPAIAETASCVVLKDEEGQTVRVIVRAENGEENVYTFTFVKDTVTAREELGAVIEEAEKKAEEDYTAESWTAFKNALADAYAAYRNQDATKEELEAAADALSKAMAALTEKPIVVPADKKALEAELAACENLAEKDYTAASWGVFKAAKEEAEAVFGKADAEQTEVDAALKKLQDARKALVKNPGTTPTPPDTSEPDNPGSGSSDSGSSGSGSSGSTPSTPASPKTGDASAVGSWFALMLFAGIVLVYTKKKYNE